MQQAEFIVALLVAILFLSFTRLTAKGQLRKEQAQFALGKTEGRKEATAANDALAMSDLRTLTEICNTLHLANQFWRPLKGTEPYQARVSKHLTDLSAMASRIRQSDSATCFQPQAEQEKAA